MASPDDGNNEVPSSATFPTLERLSWPSGAIARVTQRMATVSVPLPEGFVRAGPRCNSHLIETRRPHAGAAGWFVELHAGYHSAQFLHYCVRNQDPRTLLAVEDAELRAHVGGLPAEDNSLPARGLAVWVVVRDDHADDALGAHVLDALAHWSRHRGPSAVVASAKTVASDVRISVCTSTTASALFERTGTVADHNAAFVVLVRWPTPTGVAVETASFTTVPMKGADGVLNAVQRTLAAVAGINMLSVPPTATTSVPSRVPHGAFAFTMRSVDKAFEAHLTSELSSTLSPAAAAKGASRLTSCGVVVRLCDRKLGQAGVVSNDAFHGVLLCFPTAVRSAVEFAHGGTGVGGVRVPIGAQEESMGLHVCAVQAEQTRLCTNVSLFSAIGTPGKPIHPPCSWLWRESAAVRPVDTPLLSTFALRPCDKASLAPKEPELLTPFRRHFELASEAYMGMRPDSGASSASLPMPVPPVDLHRAPSSVSGYDLDASGSGADDARPSRAPRVDDAAAEQEERFLLAAMGVDMRSQRTTLGDLYARLCNTTTASPALCSTVMQAIGVLGVDASIAEMFRLCQRTVSACTDCRLNTTLLEVQAENKRLRAVVNTCLDALAQPETKRMRVDTAHDDDDGGGEVTAAEHARRILAALGLVAGEAVTVKRTMSPASTTRLFSTLVNVLTRDETASTARDVVAPTMTAFGTLSPWTHDVVNAHLAAIVAAILASLGREPRGVYLMSSSAAATTTTAAQQQQQAQLQRVGAGGALLHATFVELLHTRSPCVFVLHHDDTRTKLVATKPAAVVPTTASPP